MDVSEFAPYLWVMDDILVSTVVAAMFFYITYPKVQRVARRVRATAMQRDNYYRE
jgi:predicted PurR-regulated permease PerM